MTKRDNYKQRRRTWIQPVCTRLTAGTNATTNRRSPNPVWLSSFWKPWCPLQEAHFRRKPMMARSRQCLDCLWTLTTHGCEGSTERGVAPCCVARPVDQAVVSATLFASLSLSLPVYLSIYLSPSRRTPNIRRNRHAIGDHHFVTAQLRLYHPRNGGAPSEHCGAPEHKPSPPGPPGTQERKTQHSQAEELCSSATQCGLDWGLSY